MEILPEHLVKLSKAYPAVGTSRDTLENMAERKFKTLDLVLEGEIPSKKNGYMPNGKGGRYIPADMQTDIDALMWQLKPQRPARPISGPMSIAVEFTTKSKKLDADNRYTTLQDILQKIGIIENDNDVEYFTCRRNVSLTSKPSIHISITYAS